MAYASIAEMSEDVALTRRIAGCIATQDYTPPQGIYNTPLAIADVIKWRCVGQPGWAAAYEYAVNSNNPNPGADEAVITDAMILSAVQLILGIE